MERITSGVLWLRLQSFKEKTPDQISGETAKPNKGIGVQLKKRPKEGKGIISTPAKTGRVRKKVRAGRRKAKTQTPTQEK